MKKPDWKKAPKWANWLAQDSSGVWYFYSEKPRRELFMWWTKSGKTKEVKDTTWKKSLEKRPEGAGR